MKSDYTPFDFIGSVSQTKEDLIKTNDQPANIEKQYNPYIVNRGLSYFNDTILHANEMNKASHVFKDAQYRYYLSALRPRKRFSKWFKPEKDEVLDMLQQYYQCNRTTAKYYKSILTVENLNEINKQMDTGGSS